MKIIVLIACLIMLVLNLRISVNVPSVYFIVNCTNLIRIYILLNNTILCPKLGDHGKILTLYNCTSLHTLFNSNSRNFGIACS